METYKIDEPVPVVGFSGPHIRTQALGQLAGRDVIRAGA